MMKKISVLLSLILLTFSIGAQTLTGTEDEIHIWDGPGPGSEALTIDQSITERAISGECTANRAVYSVTETSIVPFIAENPSGAAVLICPGGAYSYVVIDKEGTNIAQWYNELGISAFVVKYRLPGDGHTNREYVPLQDAQRALRYVRGHAEHWGIDRDKIGIMGASAGGHMASSLATLYDKEVYSRIDTLDDLSAKPNFMVLLYPVVSMETAVTHTGSRTNLLGSSPTTEMVEEFSAARNVTSETPITFMARALDDTSVPEANCTQLRDSLNEAGVSNELHQYKDGGHGRGKCEAVGTDFYNWFYDCGKWLYANEFTASGLSLPGPPTDVTSTEVLHNSVTLDWTASADQVEGYVALIDGERKTVVTENSATLTGLIPETQYTVGVCALNLIGNSDTISIDILTLELPPPMPPTALLTTQILQDEISVKWTKGDVTTVGYKIFLDGTEADDVSSTRATITGLSSETSYTIGVCAYNTAGNSDTITIDVVTLVGLDLKSWKDQEVLLSPNPVATLDQLVFKLPDAEALTINLYDLSGKVLDCKEVFNIAKGSYTFEFKEANSYLGFVIIKLSDGAYSYSKMIQVSGIR